MKKMTTKPVRIRLETERLLKAFNTSSIDESIMKMWKKLCKQGKELNQWRIKSGCKNPTEFKNLLKNESGSNKSNTEKEKQQVA